MRWMFRPYARSACWEIFRGRYHNFKMKSSSLDLLFNILFLPVSFAFFLFVLLYLFIAVVSRPRPQRDFSPPEGPWPSGYLYRLLDEINFRNLFPAKNPALEIGIETGETSDQIFENFEFLLGIERFKHFIPAFKDKTRWRYKIIGDATSLPFVSDSLINIAAISVFNNIPKEQIVNVIKECARVLEPGGALVFTAWGPAILDGGLWGAFLVPLVPRKIRRALSWWTLYKGDQYYFPLPELKILLKESGLSIETIVGYWDNTTCRAWATVHYVFFRRSGMLWLNIAAKLGWNWPRRSFMKMVNNILADERFYVTVPVERSARLYFKVSKQ